MSQQINLLPKRQDRRGLILLMVVVACAIVAGVTVYRSELRDRSASLREVARQGEQQLVVARAAMQAKTKTGGESAEDVALRAEVDALKQKLDAGQQLKALLDKGDIGNAQGYARYLMAFAAVSEGGVWLTNVVVTEAGKKVAITGRAMHNESVLKYAQRLNEVFAPYGIQFGSMEMTPETYGQSDKAAPTLSTVLFKLS